MEQQEQKLDHLKKHLAALVALNEQCADVLFWAQLDEEGGVVRWERGEGSVPLSEAMERGQPDVPHAGPARPEPLERLLRSAEAGRTFARMVRYPERTSFEESIEVDGSSQIWSVQLTPIDSTGEASLIVLGTAEDISDRFYHTNRLRETEQRYRQLMDLMPDAVSIIDTSGRVRYVNHAGKSLLGARETDEVVGRSYWEFVHPDDTRELRARALELRKGKPLDQSECRMLRFDGSTVPVEFASVPVQYCGEPAVLGTGRDLSVEQQLQQQLRLVRHAVESMDAAVAIFKPDGMSIYHNPAFTNTFGYTPETLNQEKGFGTFFHESERADVVLDALHKRSYWRGDVKLLSASGEMLSMALRANVVFDDDREPIGVVCILTDITERRRQERRLLAAKQEAEELARLRSTILTNLTHEVRTPLTVILGFTSMLRQGVKKKYTRFVDLIERSGRRLLLMLDAVLDLAQLEAGSFELTAECFNVVDVAEGVVTTLQPVARDKGLELRLEASEPSVPAELDHRVLGRILENLLDNAIKFTNDGSVRLVVERRGEDVMLQIIDTGVGIDRAFLPRIFEEFTQESTGMERTHQGSGLGLAVSERLVKQLGGSIEVESEKDQGTTFTVCLPANMGA